MNNIQNQFGGPNKYYSDYQVTRQIEDLRSSKEYKIVHDLYVKLMMT